MLLNRMVITDHINFILYPDVRLPLSVDINSTGKYICKVCNALACHEKTMSVGKAILQRYMTSAIIWAAYIFIQALIPWAVSSSIGLLYGFNVARN